MDKNEFQAKFMFYMMCKGIEEVGKADEDMKEEMEEYEAKINWNIGENLKGYQIFEGGKYYFAIDELLEDADVTMIIPDANNAKLFFTGKLDPTGAYMSGDLTIEGNLQVIMEYSGIADLLQEFLEPLTGSL